MRIILIALSLSAVSVAEAFTFTRNVNDVHAEYSGDLDNSSPGAGVYVWQYKFNSGEIAPDIFYEGTDWTGDFLPGTRLMAGTTLGAHYRDGLTTIGLDFECRTPGPYSMVLLASEISIDGSENQSSLRYYFTGANRGTEDGKVDFIGVIADDGYVMHDFAITVINEHGEDYSNEIGVSRSYQRIGAVPEPSSFAALGLGLLGLMRKRLRRG